MDYKARPSLLIAFIATVFTAFAFIFLFFFIGYNQRNNAYEDSKLLAKEISRKAAFETQVYLASALMTARSIDQRAQIIRKYNGDRKEIVNLLRNTLVRNPNFMGAWTMWEPNAYDNKDKLFTNDTLYDKNGAFCVCFFKNQDRIYYEKNDPNDYLADYYTVPQKTLKELILDPFTYQYHGHPFIFYQTSAVVPIIVDNKFLGVFGIDISLKQLRADLIQKKVYKTGYLSLISNNGTIVTHLDSNWVDKNFFELLQDRDSLTKKNIVEGNEYAIETKSEFTSKEVFRFFYPIKVGNGSNPWSMMVEIPIEEATIRSKQLWYIAIGTIIVGLSLLIYLIFNILERRKYERDILIAKQHAEESDRLKSAFLNNISHEIRTPLNGIMGFTELIADAKTSEKQAQDYKEIIRSSSNQLLSVISNVLELSKIQAGNVEVNFSTFDIEKTILNLIASFSYEIKEKQLTLETNFPAKNEQRLINSDEDKFQQILSNLINNAIKFTSKGGIEVGYLRLNDAFQFFVKDTGVGIKPENAKKIYQFFTQEDQSLSRSFGGLGVGLSIAKSYVELLNGTISFESQPGTGTTFFFTLPRITSKVTKSEEMDKSPDLIALKHDQTVLVVEDEEFNLFLMKEILKNSGIVTLTASNGAEAVEICQKDSTVDLVLMDIRMPVMNGYEATKIIKSIRKDLPVIAVTAFTQAQDSSQKNIFDSFISKPYVKDEVTKIVSRFLHNVKD